MTKTLSSIVSNDTANNVVQQLLEVKNQMKDLKAMEEALKQQLYNYMGEHDVLIDCETGQETAKWTYSEGFQKFDVKKFMADKPRVYKQYLFLTEGVRTLRLAK